MGTTAQKLTYLNDTKGLLKDSINSLGGNITSQTTFRQYATELDSIYSNLPKVSVTGSILSLTPTLKGRLESVLKGNTLQNGTPTPDSPVEIQSATGLQNITVCGKNLFDKSSAITGKYYNENCVLTTPSTNGFCELININESLKYSLKIDNNYGSTIRLIIFVFDKNLNKLVALRWSDTLASGSSYTVQNYTMPSGAKYITISVLDMQPTTENINKIPIQLEVGSTATYEAYQSQTKELNLGNIKLNKIGDYQDYITGTPNNWSIKRQIGSVVLDGSENWYGYRGSGSQYTHRVMAANNIIIANVDASMISDKFIENQNATLDANANGIYCNATNTIYVSIDKTLLTGIEPSDFKSWLSSNNTQVDYVLATETTETITNQEIINQLNEIYNLQSYNGTTNITITSEDLALIMNASAIKGE